MEFNRPPRIQQTLEFREIVVPAPKALPTKPKISWLTLTLPLVGTMLAVGLMVAFYGSTSGFSVLFFLPMVLASVVASIVTSVREKKDYTKQLEKEKADYAAVLDRKETELASLVSEQRKILESQNPDLAECAKWVAQMNPRLGERRPTDADFLSFRFGTGRQKAGLEIKPPSEDGRDETFLAEYTRADNLADRFGWFGNVPVMTSFLSTGCLGVAGTRDQSRQLVRAALAHLLTHHWPQEMNLGVICDSVGVVDEWKWLDKLPHRTQIFSPAVLDFGDPLQKGLETLEVELHRRQALLYHQRSLRQEETGQVPFLPAVVMVFDHIDSMYERAAFSIILREGRALGMYGIILVDRFEDIPAECGAALEIKENRVSYRETGAGKIPVEDIKADAFTKQDIENFSSGLAAIQWSLPSDATEPPSRISLLELFGASDPETLQVQSAWDGDHPFHYLRAPIGRLTPSADLIFDLNESGGNREVGKSPENDAETHGPHGVIGGMTGSGKSELLRTIILSLAMTHHPYDINFALIDYKGGGAFKDLEDLPHVVGVVTDIENHANYAGRVIQSLSGEINTRKQILAEAQITSGLQRPHIDDYRKLEVKRPLPRLIIIFDEFAEFKDQHPEESQKLINIARQGRSLGVHLILCTQNPATAIDDQVRQNSKFAISLGVNSPDDSRNLIGIPDAFGLPPGMAFIFVKSPEKFRVAFSGSKLASGKYAGKTEAQAIVQLLSETAKQLGFETPSPVWPAPLPERLYLPDLLEKIEESGFRAAWNGSDWESSNLKPFGYLLGHYDDPIHQSQPLHVFGSPGTNQNLLAFGASQSGKSTLLLTLAIGIARTYTPAQAQIYCLDLGGHSLLYKLRDLPHAPLEGAIINGNDRERINSLFSFLRRQIARRKQQFQDNNDAAGESQEALPGSQLPLIYILIDGLTSRFTDQMDNFNDQLAEVILEGQSVGINTIITANVYQDINFRIFSYITNRLILRPVEKTQVDNVVEGIPPHLLELVLRPDLPPGRGLVGGRLALEFQTALPVQGLSDEEQGYYLDDLISYMANAWGDRPRPSSIRVLPPHLTTDDLQSEVEQLQAQEGYALSELPIALNRDMRPCGFSLLNDGPAFLVTSAAPRQGKTTLIQSWVSELAAKYSPAKLKILLIDFHTHALRRLSKLAHVPSEWFVARQKQLEPALNSLKDEIVLRGNLLEKSYQDDPENFDPGQFLQDEGLILVVIDDYNTFRLKAPQRELLKECMVLGEECGVRLLIAETSSLLGYPSYDDILMNTTRSGCGISLGGFDSLETYFNQAKISAAEKTQDFPTGRGYIVRQGRGHIAQFATCCPGDKKLEDVLREKIVEINKKHSGTKM